MSFSTKREREREFFAESKCEREEEERDNAHELYATNACRGDIVRNKKEEGMSKDGRDRGSSSHVGRKGDDLTGASIFSAQTDVSLILFEGFTGFFARIDWRGL